MTTTDQRAAEVEPATHEPVEYRGRAMGSEVHILVVPEAGGGPTRPVDPGDSGAAIVEQCRRELDRLEALWSRFLPTSEISTMNDVGGPTMVSPETMDLVRRSIEAWHRTNGRFDPTVLNDLAATGYDRDFDAIGRSIDGATPPTGQRADGPRRADRPGGACGRIEADPSTATVELPDGVAFDPGGIGKGLAADRVTAVALRLGATGAMVNVGGDLRCRGRAPGPDGWAIAVRSDGVSPTRVLALADGGVATSTCLRRRWATEDGPAHHLIDPTTGQSRPDAAQQVTVVAATAAEAETIATAVAVGDISTLAASGQLDAMLGSAGILVVDHLGRHQQFGSIDRYLR